MLCPQALELNDDSKPEQLIVFLDEICRLRYDAAPGPNNVIPSKSLASKLFPLTLR